MADYNSNYTGQEIDEAVGTVLSTDVFLLIATSSNDFISYTFNHTLEDVIDAANSGENIVCLVSLNGTIYPTFVTSQHDAIAVYPISNTTDVGYVPRVFTINQDSGGNYSYSVLPNESRFVIPYSFGLKNYAVPMVNFGDSNLCFDDINLKVDLENSLEQLILGAMSLTDVATVSTDPTFVAGAEAIADQVCRNMKAGRGSIAYQTISTLGNITIMGAFTGAQEVYSGNDERSEVVVFANIDVFVGGSSGGVYNSIDTYHGTANVAVKYQSDSVASVAVAIHLDHHTPTIM